MSDILHHEPPRIPKSEDAELAEEARRFRSSKLGAVFAILVLLAILVFGGVLMTQLGTVENWYDAVAHAPAAR
jgi:hypothetical protein